MRSDQDLVREYFSGRAAFYERIYDGRASAAARYWWRALPMLQERSLRALPALEGKRVLEIGCGTGDLSVALARGGASVVAIDLSPGMIDAARRRAARAGVDRRIAFHVSDFAEWTSRGDRYDHVVAIAAFEYCSAPERWMTTIAAVGGDLVATFPLRVWWQEAIRRCHYALRGGVTVRFFGEEQVSHLLRLGRFGAARTETIGSHLWVHATREVGS